MSRSFIIRLFWILLACLCSIGLMTLGLVGIPSKPVIIVKTVPDERFPQ